MARVSNPDNQDNKATAPKLIRYLISHKHWSPFEMVNACVEIKTTRDTSHQIIRHRSFAFQEYSGRYATYDILRDRECRIQDRVNRQNSLPAEPSLQSWFKRSVEGVADYCGRVYEEALVHGVAKEVARSLLPEGLIPSILYMNGSLRSWIHYFDVRCGEDTQKEHRLIALECRDVILEQFPMVKEAYYGQQS